MSNEIWILGATGRARRIIAKKVADAGYRPVLVGRDRARLEPVAAAITAAAEAGAGTGTASATATAPRIVAGTLEEQLAELAASDAALVVNTVGPFVDTAPGVISALPHGTH